MRLIVEAMHAMGAVLLQIAVGLLIEELMFGGLVRLILAPRPVTGQRKGRKDTGEDRCSH
jgi:hypothetical protein